MLALEFLGAWLIADFWSGLAHWWLDHHSRDDSSLGIDNESHHSYPWRIAKISKWDNLSTSFPHAISVAILLFLMGVPNIFVIAMTFLSIGNLIHRWSHDARRSSIIRLIQWTGFFQSYAHHYAHHYPRIKEAVPRKEARSRFCVMTNYLNPILDRVGFFQQLDRLVSLSGR